MMHVNILQTIKEEYERSFISARNNYTAHCSNEIEILSFTVPEIIGIENFGIENFGIEINSKHFMIFLLKVTRRSTYFKSLNLSFYEI